MYWYRYELTRYSLKIESVNKSDSGSYACLARNKYGQDWLNFTVTVTGTNEMNMYVFNIHDFRKIITNNEHCIH